MKDQVVQEPLVKIGTVLHIGDRKATVVGIGANGVTVQVEGVKHRPVVGFDWIERAVMRTDR